jgi:hypothetical protein
MNITLSTEEFSGLCNKISEWYDRRSKFLIEAIMTCGFDQYRRRPDLDIDPRMKQWEAENPKPDWKTLL